MNDKNVQDKKSKSFTALWITAFILVVLVLISAVFATSAVNKQMTTSDIISLTPEDSQKTVYDIFYKPVEGDPNAVTGDEISEWTAKTNINLFKSSYTNEYGKTTVQAVNDNKVIAPGTSNIYSFTLANKGNIELKYTLTIKGLFGLTEKNVPITLRLRKGNEWVFGSETEWVNAKEIGDTINESNVTTGKSDVYTLEWLWPFENGKDGEDSLFGNADIDADNDFTITITTVAEVAPGAVAKDEDGNLLYKRIMEPMLFATIIIAGLFVTILSVVYPTCVIKRRKREEADLAEANKTSTSGSETSPTKEKSTTNDEK